MNNFSSNNLRLLFPSILDTIFIIILLFIIFIDAGEHLLRDADTGFHIMTGRYILENLSWPSNDIFSYTCAGKEWVAFSWGTGVVFAIMDKLAGLNGVILISTLLILSTLFISYKLLLHWKVNFFVLILSIVTTTCMFSVHWLARPHLFTVFFTALTFYILEIAKDNKKLYYLMPLIIILWANFHPGFISGFFVLGAYFVGNIIELILTDKTDFDIYKDRIKTIFIVSIISLFGALINPYGFKLFVYIYKTLTSHWIVNATSEYLTPNFHGTLAVIVFEFVILGIILFGLSKQKKALDMPKILILVFWLHLALFAIRNIAIFSVIGVPCLALLIQSNLDNFDWPKFKENSERLLITEKSINYHIWPLILILITTIAALNNGYLFNKKVMDCHFSPKRIPVVAMSYYEKHPIAGNMLNQDNWGGYIMYRYPGIKVFMDGRLDMYQQDFLDEYQTIILGKPGWEGLIKKYNVKWVIFSNNTIFHNVLDVNANWEKVYSDSMASIFVIRKDKKE